MNRTLVVAVPGTIVSSSPRHVVADLGPARDLAFGVSPSYRRVSATVDGVRIEVYGAAGNIAAALAAAKAAVASFDSHFGPYPYRRYVVAQSPRQASGNEYPGIVFLGAPLMGNAAVVRHETAHQWWYGLVGGDQMRSPWIDEGLAEWSTRFAGHAYCSARKVSSAIYAFPNVQAPATSGDCGSYDQTVYYKAASMIQGVRTRMGDTAFFRALRAICSEYRFGVVTTGDIAEAFIRFAPDARKARVTSYLRTYIDW